MKKILFLWLCVGMAVWAPLHCAQAQEAPPLRYTLSGYVKDAETGEDLIGVTVSVPALKTGTVTNEYGFYSLNLPAGDTLTVEFYFIGYEKIEQKVYMNDNRRLDLRLRPEALSIEQVVITTDPYQDQLDAPQMSVERLSMEEVKSIPVIFGEADLVKVLQLKPGVQSGSEGSSGLYVRGGGADQNLILLDEALVYNPSHLFGFFSIFNPDAVKDVTLYKGDFPAKFGGRLSSVLDVRLKEGNKQKFSGEGGVGLISSRLTLEAPLAKDKSSFIVSGRRTYFDLITRQINKANEGNPDYEPIPDYYFYDLNTKVNIELNDKNRLFLSGYFGRDVFQFNNDNFNFNFDWGNATTTLRWNRIITPRLFMNASFIFSDYKYQIKNQFNAFNFNIGSGIRDYNGKLDFEYSPNSKHFLRFGYQHTYHQFEVSRLRFESEDGRVDFESGQNFEGHEMGAYIQDDIDWNDRWRSEIGLRISAFTNQGKWYHGVEPRASVRWRASDKLSFKAGYALMNQYVHLVSNSGTSLPTDIWYPSNRVVAPQRSQQIAAGMSRTLWQGTFFLNTEVYYKWMDNQIDYKDGAQLFFNDNLDTEFVFGKGWGYGWEVYLEKKKGRTTGWIGYTLSWTFRQFADSTNGNAPINNGKAFFPRYDRRHDLSVVLMHRFTERWSAGFNFVFGTGNAFSLPTGRFIHQDLPGKDPVVVPVYPERNNYRLPDYHRADLNITYKLRPRWGEGSIMFSVYNVYNRRNAFFVYFEEVKDPDTNQTLYFQAKQVTLFPMIPTFTLNFKF